MSVSITTQPASQKCLENGAAQFSVVASTTNGPLTYQWFKNGSAIGGQTASSLSLTSVQKVDEGQYKVTVNDADGNPVTSSQVSLLVSCEKGLVPILSANSGNPGGQVVTASTQVAGTGDAYRAFDGQISAAVGGGQDGWSTPANTPSGTLQIFFPASQLVRRYRIYPPAQLTSAPLSWTLQGSLDGSGWTVLDTRTNVTGWTLGVAKEFSSSATISYTYFRLVISSNQTGSGTLGISEWILFNDALLNVAITFPSSGARENLGDTIDIQVVTNKSSNRSIQGVKFYANATLLGTNTSVPYDFSWMNSDAGSFNLTAVIVNDLGEQIVSPVALTVWSSTPASQPPVVVVADPIDGATFPLSPAIIPISYVVSSPGTYIKKIEIIVDGSTLDTKTGPLGNLIANTFVWRGNSAGLGAHTIEVRATDYNNAVTTSDIVTVTFVANTVGVVKYGTPTVATATTGSTTEITGAVAYVWRFWDSTSVVTTKGAAEYALNRSTCQFSVGTYDVYGRFQVVTETGTDVTIDTTPRITKIILPESQQVVPYLVELVVSAKDTSSIPVFAWKDAIGNLLATSSPSTDNGANFVYVHRVTSVDEKIFLTVGETDDWSNQYTVDFTLPGKINTPPVVSPIATGLRPKAWVKVLPEVLCTTTAPLTQLAGQPILDGVQISPVWTPGTPSRRLGPSRVLVKNQLNRSQNGIYLTTTSQLSYDFTIGASGIVAGKVQFDGIAALWISNFDRNGIDVSQPLAEHLVIGNLVVLSYPSTTNFTQFQVTSITAVTGGFQVGVVQTNANGTVATGSGGAVDFGWTRTSDVFVAGVTVQATQGATNGGDYFAAVTDFDSEAANPNTSVQFNKVNIDYSGSAAPKSVVYAESASEDLTDLDCNAVLDFLTTTSTQTFTGEEQTLLRAKILTQGIAAGDYVMSETVADMSSVQGFVSAVTTLKATLTIVTESRLDQQVNASLAANTSGSSSGSSSSSGSGQTVIVNEITTRQVFHYVSDPNTEGLVPDNKALDAVAYKKGGGGPIFEWNTDTLHWD